MTYQTFKDTLLAELRNHFPPDTTITIQSISKNNQVSIDGLTILESGFNIAPTIYLPEYYKQYDEGIDFSIIFQKILDYYYRYRPNENIDPAFFCSLEHLKSRIAFKLINYQQNRKLLTTIPHIPYLDLAIVFFCLVTTDSYGSATMLIQNSHLELWNIDSNQLFELAMQNTPVLLPYQFDTITHIMNQLLPSNTQISDIPFEDVFILTNKHRLLGAACILYPDLLSEIGDHLNSDFYLIPSSIHEVIILPWDPTLCREEYNQLICEVNRTQLEPTDVLSDHLYYYDRAKGQLTE